MIINYVLYNGMIGILDFSQLIELLLVKKYQILFSIFFALGSVKMSNIGLPEQAEYISYLLLSPVCSYEH